MLAAQGIIADSDAEAIGKGLVTVLSEITAGTFPFRVEFEDIHMNVEARLAELIGPAAGRLHTARSRNDQVAVDFRLWVRGQCDAAVEGIGALMAAFLDQAEAPTGPLAAGWVGGTFNVMSTRTSTYSAAWMAGAYFATPSDLARWWQALMTGRVVNASSLAAMMTPVAPENYGLGMSRRVLAGRTIWSHTGEIRGFSSVGLHDPAKRASLVVIVNENPGPAVGIASALLTIVAGIGGP